MRFHGNLSAVIILTSMFLLPARGSAGEATVQLSATVNELVTILVNTPVAELRANGLPDKALKLVYARFDFSELTKRSLGRHWLVMDQSQQREFVAALTQKLLVAYGRTVRASGDEKIEFNGEERDGDFANVETKVVSASGALPIDYRLHFVDGQWKVYDMVIDQVSIVNNYRAQFDRVIAKSSVKELLQKMKEPAS
jgi:phospholipid transport system substrate-binding protein